MKKDVASKQKPVHRSKRVFHTAVDYSYAVFRGLKIEDVIDLETQMSEPVWYDGAAVGKPKLFKAIPVKELQVDMPGSASGSQKASESNGTVTRYLQTKQRLTSPQSPQKLSIIIDAKNADADENLTLTENMGGILTPADISNNYMAVVKWNSDSGNLHMFRRAEPQVYEDRALMAGNALKYIVGIKDIPSNEFTNLGHTSRIQIIRLGTRIHVAPGSHDKQPPMARVRVWSPNKRGDREKWNTPTRGRMHVQGAPRIYGGDRGECIVATIPQMCALLELFDVDLDRLSTTPIVELPSALVYQLPKGTINIYKAVKLLLDGEPYYGYYDDRKGEQNICVMFAPTASWAKEPLLWF